MKRVKRSPAVTKRARRPARRAARAANREISIRMYNVGFGDCFLLKIPDEDRDRKILVDCGVHPSGPGPRRIADVARQVVADVTEDGKALIDVVIATHRHADHVSGFENDVWDNVTVREVWLPWTEDPRDPEARRILEKQSRAAAALADVPGLAASALALANNSLKNAAAMRTLHDGFAGRPHRRFLPARDRRRATFSVDSLPNVTVHAMGPARDVDTIRDMDPPAGASYLLLSGGSEGAQRPSLAFDSGWIVEDEEVWQTAPHLLLNDWERGTLRNLGELDAFSIAVSIEKAINGTSLMLMLQVGRAYLLFPGDAQWGTWQRALADPEWRDLLAKTTFYKVGHHGSHNATPKEFVQKILGDEFWSMACTREKTLDWDIPRKPLLKALRAKCPQVVRSDRRDVSDPTEVKRSKGNLFVDLAVPM